jgi:hypothetical protein
VEYDNKNEDLVNYILEKNNLKFNKVFTFNPKISKHAKKLKTNKFELS